MTAKQIAIRWKPHMWWAYFDGADTSNLHGGHPEDLVIACKSAWPEAEIEIDWSSAPPTDANRLATLEAALRTIHEAIPKFLHPTSDMTNQEFIGIVLRAVDNAKVNKALEGNK